MATGYITVWRLIAHHAAPVEAARWFSQSNVIAIGWGDIGSVKTRYHSSAADIADAIRHAYPDLRNSGSGGVCLDDFCHRMKLGDLVIVSADARRSLVMEVEGDYEFKPSPEPDPIGDYQHERRATSIAIDPDALWTEAGACPRAGHNIRWTLIECQSQIDHDTKENLVNKRRFRSISDR